MKKMAHLRKSWTALLLTTMMGIMLIVVMLKTYYAKPLANDVNSSFAKGLDAFEKRNWQRAEYYLNTAMNDVDEARYYLANLWNQGASTEKDKSRDDFQNLLDPLLKRGDTRALREMGIFEIQLAEKLQNSDPDLMEEALIQGQFYLEQAAEKSDFLSEYLLGWSYLQMKEPLLELGYTWLEKASSHDLDGRATYLLGVSKFQNDDPDFIEIFEKACAHNFSPAQEHLGRFFFYPNSWVQQDLEKSKSYFEAASRNGNLAGMYYLGLWHLSQDEDDLLGLNWISRSAQFGHGPAAYFLGLRAEQMQEPQKDRIIEYYELAGRAGHAAGYFRLGLLYSQGVYGLDRDFMKSRYYFEKASSLGSLDAENNLGLLYFYGLVREPHGDELAKQWFEKAAKQGHPQAKHNLQIMKSLEDVEME